MTSTYSSGQWNQKKIITTDLRGMCTAKHTGTSASAPIAAAIVALALESNPNLTWRDMQHIVIRTSKPRLLIHRDSMVKDKWRTNGVGREYSHHYGYGLMDAGAMVEMAKDWQTVPEQKMCTKRIIEKDNHFQYRAVHPNHTEKKPINIDFYLTKSDCNRDSRISKMEHVIVRLDMQSSRRGDMKLVLISPAGTESVIMDYRKYDSSNRGFHDHDLLTVHMWDENPYGVWRLKVINLGGSQGRKTTGVIRKFDIVIYGTVENGDSSQPDGDIQLGSEELKNGLWPGVHRGWKLPRPRFTYRDISGYATKVRSKPKNHSFSNNVFKYLSSLKHSNPPRYMNGRK